MFSESKAMEFINNKKKESSFHVNIYETYETFCEYLQPFYVLNTNRHKSLQIFRTIQIISLSNNEKRLKIDTLVYVSLRDFLISVK